LEAFWNRVTLLVGCAAIVAIVASVIVVITKQAVKEPLIDEEYFTTGGNTSLAAPKKSTPEKSLMQSFSEHGAERAKHATSATREPTEEDKSAPEYPLPQPPPMVPSIVEAMKALPIVAGIENIETKRDAISRALELFFEAKTIDEKLLHVRNSSRIKPLMLNYYAREPMPTARFRGLGMSVRVDEPGYRFGYVQALFEDGDPVSLIVEETDIGSFLVDWEHFVRYGELSWSDFQRMKPLEPKLLRVLASKATGTPSVSALAPSSSQWLELRHPSGSGTVLGYFDPTDPRYAPLVEQLEHGNWKDVPVTLRLCFPTSPTRLEGAGVRIAGVEGKAWLTFEPPNHHG
jgi:hypothetical protein